MRNKKQFILFAFGALTIGYGLFGMHHKASAWAALNCYMNINYNVPSDPKVQVAYGFSTEGADNVKVHATSANVQWGDGTPDYFQAYNSNAGGQGYPSGPGYLEHTYAVNGNYQIFLTVKVTNAESPIGALQCGVGPKVVVINLVNAPGNVIVVSNIPTCWTINGPTPKRDCGQVFPYSAMTPGSYSITPEPQLDYSLTPPESPQTLDSGKTITFYLTYSPTNGGPVPPQPPNPSPQPPPAPGPGPGPAPNPPAPVGYACLNTINNSQSVNVTVGSSVSFYSQNGSGGYGWTATPGGIDAADPSVGNTNVYTIKLNAGGVYDIRLTRNEGLTHCSVTATGSSGPILSVNGEGVVHCRATVAGQTPTQNLSTYSSGAPGGACEVPPGGTADVKWECTDAYNDTNEDWSDVYNYYRDGRPIVDFGVGDENHSINNDHWGAATSRSSYPQYGVVAVPADRHIVLRCTNGNAAIGSNTVGDDVWANIASGPVAANVGVNSNTPTGWTLNAPAPGPYVVSCPPACSTYTPYENAPVGDYTLNPIALAGYTGPLIQMGDGTPGAGPHALANGKTLSFNIFYVSNPTNLNADSSGCAQVKLSWTNYNPNSPLYKTSVWRSNTSGGPYAKISPDLPGNANTYTDSSGALNTTYYYIVKSDLSTPAMTGQSAQVQGFVVQCNANLSNSSKFIFKVNNNPYIPSTTVIRDGNDVTFKITITNTGSEGGVINNITDTLSSTIKCPCSAKLDKADGAGLKNTGVAGAAPNLTITVNGTIPVNKTWIVELYTKANLVVGGESNIQNTETTHCVSETSTLDCSITKKALYLFSNSSNGVRFREVAP